MASDVFQRYLEGQNPFRPNDLLDARMDQDFRIGQTHHSKAL
jgi:hypothetical protein